MTAYAKIHPKHLRLLLSAAESWIEERVGEATGDLREATQAANRELAHVDRVKAKRAPTRKARQSKRQQQADAWDALKKQLRARCGGRCENPECRAFLAGKVADPDHYWGQKQDETLEGCWVLCRTCHDDKGAGRPSRQVWADRFERHALWHGYSEQVARVREQMRTFDDRRVLDAMRLHAEGGAA